MDVWFLSAYDQPRGQSTRTYDFSRELVSRGHSVTFFTNSYCHFTHKEILGPAEKWRIEIIDGVRVVWLRTISYKGNGIGRGLNMLSNFRQILRVSKHVAGKPDILIGPSVPLLTGWAAERLATRYRVPYVFEVRDVWPDALVDIGGLTRANPIYWIFKFIERRLYRTSGRVSSTLPFLNEHVSQNGGGAAKVVWIPNGIDFSVHSKNGSERSENCDIRKDILNVMYIGGFGMDHDVQTIISAAKLLQDVNDGRFKFIIIGSGVKKLECVMKVRDWQLRNVEFRDPISKSKIYEVQEKADILVAAITNSPSYRFGLNLNKLCSYFVSARPVLFSGSPPNNPVDEAGAGISIPAERPDLMVDALRRFALLSRESRLQMGENGRRFAEEQLSMKVLGARMESMLKAVITEYAESSD